MSERSKPQGPHWPFEAPIDYQIVAEVAKDLHVAGESWPMAISHTLIHFAFVESQKSSQHRSPKFRAIFAYLNLLGAIQNAESFIAEGDAFTKEERDSLYEEHPIPIDIEIEMFLEDDRHAAELKRDPSAISLLKKLVIERMNQQAALDPQVGKLVEENKIISFEDLPHVPNLVDKSPNNAARVRAVSDYERIYNLVTQNQKD